jgi:CheY-like chemotaxis protein
LERKPRHIFHSPNPATHIQRPRCPIRTGAEKLASSVILYADDNLNIVDAWKTLLTQKGYKVRTASDGQAFVSHPLDLVLLDYHMPGINGDVAAARMKALKADVLIALLSAEDAIPVSHHDSVDIFISSRSQYQESWKWWQTC